MHGRNGSRARKRAVVGVLMLALLTVVASRRAIAPEQVIGNVGLLLGFLLLIVVGGVLIVPPLVRYVAGLGHRETLLVGSIGLCFALALIAQRAGYSVALGAFLAGSLVAESGRGHDIELLVRPVRDVFAAIFFVAVGMMVDPRVIVEHVGAVVLLTLVVVTGKILSVSVSAFLSGHDTRTSVQAGLSMAQIGEFSFIIAAVGVNAGVVAPFMHPVIVAVCVLTTFLTPWLIRRADAVALEVDRRMPRRVQLFVSLYATWLERLRESRRQKTRAAQVRRLLVLVGLDTAIIAVIVIAASIGHERLMEHLVTTRQPTLIPRTLLLTAAAFLIAPFAIGVVRCSARLGGLLGEAAVPPPRTGQADFGEAPRRALMVTLQLGIVVAVLLPLLAVTQPFLPSFAGLPLMLLALVVLAWVFWARASELQKHVRAGAQLIAEVLQRGAVRETTTEPLLAPVAAMLPGMGDPSALHLSPECHAAGRTLAELNVRGLTGASVVAIQRGEDSLIAPDGHAQLQAGDVLALAGTHEAVRAARELLLTGRPPDAPPPARRDPRD